MTSRRTDYAEPHAEADFVLQVWKRRKWLAVGIVTAGVAATISLTAALPNLYKATASVLVERQQVSEAFVRPTVTAELETRIQTIHKQVMSRARLTDVIASMNLYPDLRGHAPIDAIVERMRRDVDFAPSGVEQTTGRTATIAFTLSYSGRDPITVAEVTNKLVAAYVEENSRSREQQAVKTAEFLKAQLDDIKRDLDQQQQRAGDFRARHTGELPQQVEVNLAALDRLNTQLRLNGEYQVRAMERRERLEQQLASPASSTAPVSPGAPVDTLASQLERLRQQRLDLRRRFTDRYPDVVRIDTQIAEMEQLGKKAAPAETTAPNSGETPGPDASKRAAEQAIAAINDDLTSLKAEERLLRQVIAGYETRVENAPRRQEELTRLSLDYETNKERYDSLLKRYEEAQLAETLEQGQNLERFRVLDPAIPVYRPVAPNRPWLALMGIVASAGLALGAVVAAEKLDTTFHTAEDVRAFAPVPMLAVIRRIPAPMEARGRRLRLALATISFAVALALIVGGAHYVGSNNEQLVRMTTRGRS